MIALPSLKATAAKTVLDSPHNSEDVPADANSGSAPDSPADANSGSAADSRADANSGSAADSRAANSGLAPDHNAPSIVAVLARKTWLSGHFVASEKQFFLNLTDPR